MSVRCTRISVDHCSHITHIRELSNTTSHMATHCILYVFCKRVSAIVLLFPAIYCYCNRRSDCQPAYLTINIIDIIATRFYSQTRSCRDRSVIMAVFIIVFTGKRKTLQFLQIIFWTSILIFVIFIQTVSSSVFQVLPDNMRRMTSFFVFSVTSYNRL